MAKAKKEAALTPEERLQAALIPDWKWPYKLPENWCWIKLNSLVRHQSGNSKLIKGKLPSEYDNGLYKAFSASGQDVFCDHFENEGDAIIVSAVGARCGKAFLATGKWCAIANTHIIWPQTSSIDLKFLYYRMNDEDWWERSGSAQPFVAVNASLERPYPLPPLAEQQRIVDRIESLFAKLDEAKEKAQAVVDSFETRKAAILHKAFTGELTAEWRNNTDIIWDYQKIKNCCNVGSGGTPSRKNSEYYNGNIPWIKTGEIEWNNIYDSEEKITESAIDNSSAKCYEPGAVLVAMYGMGVTRGKAGILCVRAATNQAVCVLEPAEDVLNNRFLLYYFMRNYWSIREKSVGGNQLNLSGTIIKELDIAIPPLDEQKEIVRILDNLFAKEQQAKEAAEAVLDQIDLMKKSILARAFRGELGTNDPADEPAGELLKKILNEE